MSAIVEPILIFLFSLSLVYLIRKYAPKLGLIDIPNDRSTHIDKIPRGAGIGFCLSVATALLLFHFDLIVQYAWTMLAILIVFVVGVLDDHHDTSPNTKFLVLIVATVFLSFDGLILDQIGTFFGVTITLGFMALPFTIFAVSGFSNAMNLIDGLDGLSATISIVIFGSFFIVGYQHNDTFLMVFSASFIASLMAFLVFNWHPASIFMGDSGSLTLGFVISVLAIKSLAYLSTVSILFITALPIFDTLIVMFRRKVRGRSIFSADRCHIHHIFREFFMNNTKKTVIFFGLLQILYSITGLLQGKDIDEGYLTILYILNIVILYFVLGAMLKDQKRDC